MADNDDERDEDEREDEGEGEGDEAPEASGAAGEPDGDQGEDEGDEAPGEAEPAAAAAAVAPPPAAAPRAGERASAGARLAAAKAAKAAKKAAKKAALVEERRAANAESAPAEAEAPEAGQEETPDQAVERQLAESPVGQAALKAQDWLRGNQNAVLGVAAAAAVGLLGWVGYNAYQGSVAASAAEALAEAVEISEARVVAEGEDEPETDADERTYDSVSARSEAALEAYRSVVAEHGGTDAAAWAQLGIARLLLEQGEAAEARQAFEAAVAARGSDPVLAMRAYEGVGFTYEAEDNLDEARDAFDRIRGLRDGAFGALADYHLARLSLANGDEVAAQEALETLVDGLRADSESAEPEFPYVLAQAQTLLRQLDPSSSDGSDTLDIEEMVRRMMAERGAGGGAE
jgi:tetratricopeptide (TPR) repeat protein